MSQRDHAHCFHREDPLKAFLGGAMFGGGGDSFDICCHCGMMRAIPKLKADAIPDGHGPYSIHSKTDTLASVDDSARTLADTFSAAPEGFAVTDVPSP